MNTAATETLIDAQPYPPRSPDSAWSKAADNRDLLYDALAAVCRDLGIDALVHRSLDFQYPSWVLLKAWLPVEGRGSSDRVELEIQITPRPYFRFECEYSVRYRTRDRERKFGPLSQFGVADLQAWARFALGHGPRPRRRNRLRIRPYQIWRARNRVLRLRRDPMLTLAGILAVVGFVGLGTDEEAVQPFGVLGLVLAAAVAAFALFRSRVYVNVARPVAEPRNLRQLDSWQVVVSGLGPKADDIRAQLHGKLSEEGVPGLQRRIEQVSYLGPDGKKVREQLVLTLGRGIVFCHVYAYGDDLFVGWDAHMNYGTWEEFEVSRGTDRDTGRPTIINSVRPGVSRVTEYDLIDLASVSEWTHARLVALIKRLLDEHKIDQGIDFQITRGERRSLLQQQDQDKQPRTRLFRRSG